ncbi:hypothetical protein QJS10_CPA10g01458 [Acorus calamus]|uniref:Uncharacterized protein n=1 Tax=Acorus calamus TaxID=4465 RepID=A0AAV9DXW5_ACOCL|nr:hypothetical protein QJS10_CPA10g01458 [Acorus calamus]
MQQGILTNNARTFKNSKIVKKKEIQGRKAVNLYCSSSLLFARDRLFDTYRYFDEAISAITKGISERTIGDFGVSLLGIPSKQPLLVFSHCSSKLLSSFGTCRKECQTPLKSRPKKSPQLYQSLFTFYEGAASVDLANLAFEFGDGLLDLQDYPEGFPKPDPCISYIRFYKNISASTVLMDIYRGRWTCSRTPTSARVKGGDEAAAQHRNDVMRSCGVDHGSIASDGQKEK